MPAQTAASSKSSSKSRGARAAAGTPVKPEDINCFSVRTTDGLELFVRYMAGNPRPAGQERALVIIHGMGEHGGRYTHLPEFLKEEFSHFYAFDLRGHGRSAGIRGYSPSFDQFVDDAVAVIAEVKSQLKISDSPKSSKNGIYLLGHSMGGLIALRLLQREKKLGLVAAIISAPFMGMTIKVPAWKLSLGKVLVKTLAKFQLNNEINPSHISHDPVIIEAYVNDRLNHTKCTPRMYFDLMDALVTVGKEVSALSCPTLFLVPGQDKIVDGKATLQYFDALKDRNKALREYPEMYHEVLNETDKARVFADIRQWLKNLEKENA